MFADLNVPPFIEHLWHRRSTSVRLPTGTESLFLCSVSAAGDIYDVLVCFELFFWVIIMGNHPSNHIPLDRRDVSKFGDPNTVSLRGRLKI